MHSGAGTAAPDGKQPTYAVIRLLMLAAAVVWESARAGGSYEPVYINRISVPNDVEYELVVTPLNWRPRDGYLDPYMGNCPTFTVHGTYSRNARLPSFVTRESHVAAVAYLRQAHAAHRTVNLGWMGGGFAPVDSGVPCTFRSKALHMYNEQDVEAVISYHDPI